MGNGSVGRAVASNNRDLQFVSSHRQIVFSINFIDKTKIKKKEAGNGNFDHFFILFRGLTSDCYSFCSKYSESIDNHELVMLFESTIHMHVKKDIHKVDTSSTYKLG